MASLLPAMRARRRRPAEGLIVVMPLLLLAWPVVPLSAADVAGYLGRPIVELEVERGDTGAPDRALRNLRPLIVTEVGTPLAMEQVRESILHLFSLGRFRDIRVEATTRHDGVALRYTLVPVRRVDRLEFHGTLGLSKGRLRAVIVDRYGESPLVERVADAPTVLEALYHDAGYVNATVESNPCTARPGGPTTLVFTIDAGRRARVARLALEGRVPRPPADVFRQLGLHAGMSFNRTAIARRLGRYADALRKQGYYEADVDQSATVRPGGRLVDLTVSVRLGPRISVTFDGDRLALPARGDLVPIARERSVDEDLLEDSSRRIVSYLHRQGFWKAKASYTRAVEGRDLRIAFHVDRGRLYTIGALEITGTEAFSPAELEALLDVQPGAPFVESAVGVAAAAIAEHYRAAGYARVRVARDVVEDAAAAAGGGGKPDEGVVTLRFAITEGPRVLIGSIAFEGAPGGGDGWLFAALGSSAGQPYVRSQMLADRDAVLQALLNHGYERASVKVDATFGAAGTPANLIFVIDAGPQVLVEHVLIVGQDHISPATIRRELTLRPGEPLARDRILESQRRLSALGLFRRIRITELKPGDENRRDVLVTVEEAPATTLGYGGGFEAGTRLRRGRRSGRAVERIEFAPRGFFEIGRHNLWGKNRSVDLFTRVSLRPSDDPDPERRGGFGFNEFRAVGTYREPRAFGSGADGLVTAFIEQSIRSSFNLRQRGFHAELRRTLSRTSSLSGGYTFNQNKLFDERFNATDKPLIDRLFPGISLSTFSGTFVRDSRDDPFEPTRGELISVDAELAGRRIGSRVGFGKTLLQGFMYRRLSGSHDVILATGLRIGLATGFPRKAVQTDADGNVLLDADGEPVQTTVRDLPASKRFFAGGDTTVRGFALDRLGDASTIDQDGFPQGGNGLIIVNSELRVPITRRLGAAAFLDTGNVFQRVGDMSLGRLRGGAGFGVRYRSPIGPIRVDLGFKLGRREFANGTREGLTALHVSIGQAF